jgi:tryptophan-rich sensory protein
LPAIARSVRVFPAAIYAGEARIVTEFAAFAFERDVPAMRPQQTRPGGAMPSSPTTRTRAAVLAIGPVVTASLLGGLATYPNLVPWYRDLAKPGFTPPNWLFGPVWTALYALMAVAAWRILRLPERSPARRNALALFYFQLALNAAWSWLFFALHSPGLGLIDIVPQWLLVVAAALRFRRLDPFAAACLLPLAAWVAFAGMLNFAVWRLN